MIDRKSLSVSVGTHRQLERLGEKFDLSHRDLIGAMVEYFIVTKADPRDTKGDVPDVALKKLTQKVDGLDKRMIGFIRAQEKDLLKPILAEVRALHTRIEQASGPAGELTPAELEEQLTSVVEAMQTLLRVSFRAALVDNALRPEYREQTDALIYQQNQPAR